MGWVTVERQSWATQIFGEAESGRRQKMKGREAKKERETGQGCDGDDSKRRVSMKGHKKGMFGGEEALYSWKVQPDASWIGLIVSFFIFT